MIPGTSAPKTLQPGRFQPSRSNSRSDDSLRSSSEHTRRETGVPTSAPCNDVLGHLPDLLRQFEPGAHDRLTVLTQARPPKSPPSHPASTSETVPASIVATAQCFLQSQADLQAHMVTLRADLSSEELEQFEVELSHCIKQHQEASQRLLASYREVPNQQDATFETHHQAAQFASHTLNQAGAKTPHTSSIFDRRASPDTKRQKSEFDQAWRQYQLEHLEDASTRLMWNLMAGYVGQLSGTGLGGHLGRALTLGAAAGGLAGVPAAALGALVGLLVTPFAHTLLSDPLQAMLRDVTVTSPGAELQLELFKLQARLISDSYREQNGRPVRADFKWLDERTGVVHLLTAKDYAERMRDQLPDGVTSWVNKFVEEDLPYVFGDGIVGTLRPSLRATHPTWWTQTTEGKLTEWLGLQMFVLGPLCGAINHAVSQCFRSWKIGRIPSLEQRLALAQTEDDRQRLRSELNLAREELKRLRYHLRNSRPHEAALRVDIKKRINALEGEGAHEEVNKPVQMWQRESVWLQSYAHDLEAAIADLRNWQEPLFAQMIETRDAREGELADLQRELRAVQRQLAEAKAKSSISGNYRYRLNTLVQPQHRLNASEPETPGKRWETLSTILGKATGMLPYVAAQVYAANLQHPGSAKLSTTLVSAILPPLYFIGGGGLLGWMSRTEWAGIWRQAIAHARGQSMAPANRGESPSSGTNQPGDLPEHSGDDDTTSSSEPAIKAKHSGFLSGSGSETLAEPTGRPDSALEQDRDFGVGNLPAPTTPDQTHAHGRANDDILIDFSGQITDHAPGASPV